MERIVLEMIKDNGVRRDYRIFEHLVVRVGRSYDNDFIVADPYVGEHHCVIRVHEQGFSIEDLSTTNGTMLNSKDRIVGQVPIHSGDEITIGRTRLRFVTSHHPVGVALPMAGPNAFFSEINRPNKAWLIVVAALLLGCFFEHQESYKNFSMQKFFSVAIGMLLVVLVWAGIWAFVGRLIKHKSSFNAQLSWSALFFLLMTLFFPVAQHAGYAANSAFIEMVLGLVMFGVFFTVLIAGHLAISTFISRRNQIIVSSIISFVIITFGIMTYYASRSEFIQQPNYYSTLLPPYAKMAPSYSKEQFIQVSQKVFLVSNKDSVKK